MQKNKHGKTKLLILALLLVIFIVGVILLNLSFKFKINGKSNIVLNYGEEYKEEGAEFKILNKRHNEKIKISSDLNKDVVGQYKVTYEVKILGFTTKKVRNIEVVDTDKPTITLIGSEIATICPNATYKEEGYNAFDKYDGELTNKVERIVEDDGNIKYKVSDSSNNSTTVERKIIKKDEEAPKLSLKGSSTVTIKVGTKYSDQGYEVSDNCDNDVKVSVVDQVDSDRVGTYYVKYTAVDESLNKTEVMRKVIVNETGEKTGVIYLTFDDGANSTSTVKILNTLKNHNIKATFFVTKGGPDSIIKREFDEGHTVALHTYTHEYQNIYSSVDNFLNDLEKVSNRVYNITGKKATITRFPGGSNNTVSNKYSYGIMSKLKEKVTSLGYTYFDWNVDSNDAGACAKSSVTNKSQCVYNYVTKNLSKNRNNVVLMHDIKSYTAEALDDIINYGKNNGYIFLPITEETQQVKFR